MRENNKSAITVIVIVIAAVLFISCSVVFDKVYGNKTDNDNGKIMFSVPGFSDAIAFTDTGETYDGTEKIYKSELDGERTIYVVTAKYEGFSQNAVIGACFEGDELLGVTVVSRDGLPSFYDDRALGSNYLNQFSGTISTDPNLKSADREFIEINMLSENDRAGTALLNSVDICCEAYFKTVINKAVNKK